jgi:hypothetical protein
MFDGAVASLSARGSPCSFPKEIVRSFGFGREYLPCHGSFRKKEGDIE